LNDLSHDHHFGFNASTSNFPQYQGRVYYGFMKPRQFFTLQPAIFPDLPPNSVVSYQDLALLDNPDEGVGIICFTYLFSPCRSFDILNWFICISTFHNFHPNLSMRKYTFCNFC
jgi:hypothetical protein